MNRLSLCYVGLLVATLVVATWFVAPMFQSQAEARPQDRGGPAGPPLVAGTFLVESPTGLEPVLGPAFDPLMGLITIHNDGTGVATFQNDFGWGGLHHLDSPSHGVWTRTGPRQTTGVLYHLAFDPDGTPEFVVKLTSVTNWDRFWNSGEGVIVDERVYMPGEDPLDPNAGTPTDNVGIPHIVRRITP